MIDHCVICGGYVPEGRQVCIDCERRAASGEKMDDGGDQLSDRTLSRQTGTGACEDTGPDRVINLQPTTTAGANQEQETDIPRQMFRTAKIQTNRH